MEHDRLNDTSAGMNSMSGCINVDTPLGPRCANPDHWRPAPEEPAPATTKEGAQ